MIKESAYIELMKNCSKWNNHIESERKGRYPFLDAQTGIAQRPTNGRLYRTIDERYGPSTAGQICSYPSKEWHKRSKAPSSDATEMKFFCQSSPALAEALNASIPAPPVPDVRMLGPEAVVASHPEEQVIVEKRENRNVVQESIPLDLDDIEDMSPEEQPNQSDEDDWSGESSRRKRRKRQTKPTGTSSRKSAGGSGHSAGQTPIDPKPFICAHCGAKYKSRPGLNYHMAHVHSDFNELNKAAAQAQQGNQLISAAVDVSTFCDFCLGDRAENKKTSLPEELVSCHDCGRSGHPTCLNFTSNMIVSTKKYGWQCIECKSCAICGTSENDDQLLFCDDCDRGFHLYCLNPPLPSAPEGEWSCHLCQVEFGPKASLPAGASGPTSFRSAQHK